MSVFCKNVTVCYNTSYHGNVKILLVVTKKKLQKYKNCDALTHHNYDAAKPFKLIADKIKITYDRVSNKSS